jgi:uncharacterized protein with PIN domain
MRFVVDVPLGGLAKWLRLCGLDATLKDFGPYLSRGFPPQSPECWYLTRRRPPRTLYRPDVLRLEAAAAEGQVAEVLKRLHLGPEALAPLTRCSDCNEPLAPLTREAAAGLVPDHVLHTHLRFFRCPRCLRVYWPGSHPARIAARLAAVLEPAASPPAEAPCSQKGEPHGL